MPVTARCTWLLASAAALLSACAVPAPQATPAAHTRAGGEKIFTSARYGFRIAYPADLELRRTFNRSYLANGGWKTYRGPDSPEGEPVVALVLPDSNNITAGELRIGASRQPEAIETCTQPPASVVSGSQGRTMISGIPFATFKARDAAMSHYLIVRSYRAVHAGSCYAIDVLVFGTNPRVYDPPATPPFTKEQVFARLVPVVDNLKFIQASANAASPPILPPATYEGLLPCADCPGIDYQLNLRADHRYVLRMNYRDRDAQFEERGRWRLTNAGKVLVLQHRQSSPQQWAVEANGRRLSKLDAEGRPIRSRLNYDLTRSARFKPLDD